MSNVRDGNKLDKRLTKTYQSLFEELSNQERYQTYSVAEFYCDKNKCADPNKVNVIVRIDVDNGFHLSVPLAEALNAYDIHSTHYFLTHPERYYQIWNSEIPKQVFNLGHEVGLHTDHYYEQLTQGIDGLQQLKDDIEKLGQAIGSPIRGMVYHGHPDIDALGTTNWELTKDLASKEIGLEYHDGFKSCYIKPGSSTWQPDCDARISDFMGFSNSWGWNYYPNYPLQFLRKAKPGQVIHVAFHTKNAFRYWLDWSDEYNEKSRVKEPWYIFWKKSLLIRIRYGLFKGKSVKRLLFSAGLKISSYLLAKGLGAFWKTPERQEPDTSWEAGKDRIFKLGIPYWRNQLEQFGMIAPNGVVLEVGSGNGQWLLAYAEDAKKVIGVEPWKPIREYSKQKVAEYPELATKIQILEASAENLPVEDNSVDAILCAGVFMFTHQELALKEMVRVLKPGGKVCLTVNGLGYFWMYVLNGLRYKSVEKMKYGLSGLVLTWAKWILGKEITSGGKAVSYMEMESRLQTHGLELIDARIWLAHSLYPHEHLGFVTNYAFIARKLSV